ncbi:AAA family ATPase [Mycobacterium sp. 663a-19]|uniref:AAA family ATPase n=1 Tax=Mycobacterium sp. 663a-19 TaxID=2986148 RepID=UPI002D1EFD8C|nr:adenylate/guanylate cyclase domain-containing protein [Mycobacterium sp. 663a-19]MEB3982436.1 AAA family ATPase [Mycobacterium sp. 663a-19]
MTATSPSCGSCGAGLSATAKFCSECGAPVAYDTRSAEYKQVTVLFADVVHSMDIAAAVGPERLREIMAELADSCAAVVRRYGGTVDKFTGDGIMAVFGAPVALEDHAIRACMAALGVQEQAKRLAAEVHDCDGLDLWLRVGLNSGQVIAGEIGSGSFGYTAIGEQVGMAQRMESVAPPGGVMLSASTARLVDAAAALGEPETVHIKGADEPVPARRLFGINERRRDVGRNESTLVGRRWEMSAVEGLLDRAVEGHGAVVGVVGPPGIGKSRLVDETIAIARSRGIEVFSTFGESHASDVPFHVVARLLRDAARISDLDDETARAQVRTQLPDATDEDLALLDDLLGIRDPVVPLPSIDPDARRRRLTALINSVSLARAEPVLYVIEDAHWIDEVSESMLSEFLTVIPQTPSMVLITYRPQYRGALANVPGAQAISLAPLNDGETAALLDELLGTDPSVAAIGALIAGRAAGNPFFAQEMVRELAERGVLEGDRHSYVCRKDATEVTVPATLQAAVAARVDRLQPAAKKTLNAAAVIGSRFTTELLAAVGDAPALDELFKAELIDQVRFTPSPEFAFRHPLIRTVAYEAQLQSDRARLHRRLAAVIEARDPQLVDQNAALIAGHLEAAGDLDAAFAWHMRAASWATNREISAARLSLERAIKIADALPAGGPQRAAMRIAPRTMLCGIAWRVHVDVAGARFDELRELCAAAGDKASLAIAMAGLVMDHAYQGRLHEASQLASEAMTLIESVGDPTLTVGLSFAAIYAKIENAEWTDVQRLSQRVIDLADDDPSKGNFIFGSPLASALTSRALARFCLGHPGWHDDVRHALAMARSADPMSYATVVTYVYFPGIPNGIVRPDDSAVREIEDALRIAERSGDDLALAEARLTLGVALVHRQTAAEHDRGQQLLAKVSDQFVRGGHNLCDLPMVSVYLARERARRGDRDDAIAMMRAAVDPLFREGRLLAWGLTATAVLVETLLDHGSDDDMVEAEAAIDRVARTHAGGWVAADLLLLRMRALLARARGENAGYRDFRDRYRDMATSLGFDVHIEWAEAMP